MATITFCADVFVRRVIYDEHGLELIALVARRRRAIVAWSEIIQVKAEEVFREAGGRIDYKIGTMIEVPRACLVADKIAAHADFFSFGTNDLTQMTFGYSRDDAGTFLVNYVHKGILPADPFQELDQQGVGELVKMGIARGRHTRPDLKVGICGEHGGDPKSIEFFVRADMDYVSCSPYRVPVARLAAAQAAIRRSKAPMG